MKLICGWCGRFISWAGPPNDGKISHGICGSCLKTAKREVDEYFRRDKALRQQEEATC